MEPEWKNCTELSEQEKAVLYTALDMIAQRKSRFMLIFILLGFYLMIVSHLFIGLAVVIISCCGTVIVCDKIIKPKISDLNKYMFSYQNVLNYEHEYYSYTDGTITNEPFIITENGTKAVIYTDTEYKKGDRVFIIKCGKTPEDIICMPSDGSC